MINISKKDLKIISINFRTHAGRLINCNYIESTSYINRLLDFIENCPIIYNYILDCVEKSSMGIDIASEVKEIADSFGHKLFDIYPTTEKEIAFTYKLLKFFSNDDKLYIKCSFGYSNSTKYQDKIKGFHDRVIYPFAQDIENYLNHISINMGYDDDATYSITVQGGQVNMARDHATINANQYNGVDMAQLESLILKIIESIPQSLSPVERETIDESLDVIKEEMQKRKPKKSLLKTAIFNLENIAKKIKEITEFAAALATLIQFIQLYI